VRCQDSRAIGHLRENLAATELALPEDAVGELDGVGDMVVV